jgi:hypothetical protein
MAKQTGLGARFAVGGFDLGGDVQTLGRIGGGVPNPIIATDITQLAQARMGSVLAADGLPTGLYDGAMEAVVYFDPAANASHSQFSALPTTSSLFTFGAGAAAGSVVANLVGKQIDYAGNRGADGSFTFNVAANESDGIPLEWGFSLTSWGQSVGGAGNLASVNLGSASPGAYGAAFHIHTFSFTGTSVTFKIQESTDNAVGDPFADTVGGGFTAVSAAHGWQRIETAAQNVKQYLRVVASGTFSAWTGVIMAQRRNALKSW